MQGCRTGLTDTDQVYLPQARFLGQVAGADQCVLDTHSKVGTGGLQEDCGTPQRSNLDGIATRKGINILFH